MPPILDSGKMWLYCESITPPVADLLGRTKPPGSVSGEEEPFPRGQTHTRLSPAPPLQEGGTPGRQVALSPSTVPGLCSKAISLALLTLLACLPHPS